jgi:SHS2 domain-containing protein
MMTRRHETLAHTADVGLRASGPDLAALFEEAAAALAGLMADVAADAPVSLDETVRLEAPDLPALAYAWLNELIGLADARRAALVVATVDRAERAEPAERAERAAGAGSAGAWILEGRVRLASLAGPGVRSRLGVKSATYHRLTVEAVPGGWAMTAYLDV